MPAVSAQDAAVDPRSRRPMFEPVPDLLLRSPAARWLALAVNAALLALVLWLSAQGIWMLLGLGGTSTTLPAGSTLASNRSQAEAPALSTWHLFGNALPLADPRRGAGTAPGTTLKLFLRGVYAAAGGAGGHAIIADEQGNERSYRVGDEVSGGASLDAVFADHVVLMRAGTRETLRMPEAGTDAPGSSARSNNSNLPGGRTPGATAPFVTPSAVMPRAVAPKPANDPTIPTEALQLAKDVQVVPVLENGRYAGVRLSGGAQQLARMGLRPDDVLVSVNGIALDNPTRGTEVAESLRRSPRASVVVRRGGQPVTLTVELR